MNVCTQIYSSLEACDHVSPLPSLNMNNIDAKKDITPPRVYKLGDNYNTKDVLFVPPIR